MQEAGRRKSKNIWLRKKKRKELGNPVLEQQQTCSI